MTGAAKVPDDCIVPVCIVCGSTRWIAMAHEDGEGTVHVIALCYRCPNVLTASEKAA